MKRRQKKTKFKNGIRILFCVLGGLLVIFACVLFLINHLFSIQVPVRLRYIKDYQDFTLSVSEVDNCSNQIYPIFQYGNEIYNGVCIREVYVNYGKVKASLQMVLEEGYISLKDIQKKLSKLSFDEAKGVTYYEYRRSKEEEGNYLITVFQKDYQNATITEVTFEKKKEIIKEEVTLNGELDIN